MRTAAAGSTPILRSTTPVRIGYLEVQPGSTSSLMLLLLLLNHDPVNGSDVSLEHLVRRERLPANLAARHALGCRFDGAAGDAPSSQHVVHDQQGVVVLLQLADRGVVVGDLSDMQVAEHDPLVSSQVPPGDQLLLELGAMLRLLLLEDQGLECGMRGGSMLLLHFAEHEVR